MSSTFQKPKNIIYVEKKFLFKACFYKFDLTLELQDRFEGYIDCVKNCYNGRCVSKKKQFLCLCNTGFTGNNCSKRKPFLKTIYNRTESGGALLLLYREIDTMNFNILGSLI